MIIGDIELSKEVLVIAEIGNNHEGDFGRAREMIFAAAEAGVQAVKFQTIVPERLVSSSQASRIEQLRRYAFTRDQFRDLADDAHKAGVMFLSTPFSLDVIDWLKELVPAIKIASGDNNFVQLLRAASATGKPVLLSTGMSDVVGVMQALSILDQGSSSATESNVVVLHCVSAYPTPVKDAHLLAIPELAKSTGRVVGYSDHTLGVDAAVIAVALGARVIEKHFTLSKTQSGFRDHALSADPVELGALVSKIRETQTLLGSGPKVIQPSETSTIESARRSICARVGLPAGHILTEGDLDWLRPGIGYPPGEEFKVLGRRLSRDLSAGETLTAELLF